MLTHANASFASHSGSSTSRSNSSGYFTSAAGRPVTPLEISVSTMTLPRTRRPPRSGSALSTLTAPQSISDVRASSAAGRSISPFTSVSASASAASLKEQRSS